MYAECTWSDVSGACAQNLAQDSPQQDIPEDIQNLVPLTRPVHFKNRFKTPTHL